jgi:hypothetical protein
MKKFTKEEVIIILKAFHIDSVKGQYNKDLLAWCNNWIDNNIPNRTNSEVHDKNSYCKCKGGAVGRTVTADFKHQVCDTCGKFGN